MPAASKFRMWFTAGNTPGAERGGSENGGKFWKINNKLSYCEPPSILKLSQQVVINPILGTKQGQDSFLRKN